MRFGASSSSSSKRAILFNRRPLISLSSFIMAVAVGIISSFTFSTAYDMARSALGGERRAVAGVWRGEWDGVPAVTIKLTENGDSVSGTAVFNRIIKTDDGPRDYGISSEIPLANPQFDGRRLSFELRAEDDMHPRIFAEMELRFENEREATLRCTGREAPYSPEEPPIKMRREILNP